MDATFPEGPLKGNAMMMTTSDGDGKNRTLMFALVSSETGGNWEWFIRMAKKYFPNLRLLLNDRQKGLQSERVKHFLRKAGIIMRLPVCISHLQDQSRRCNQTRQRPHLLWVGEAAALDHCEDDRPGGI